MSTRSLLHPWCGFAVNECVPHWWNRKGICTRITDSSWRAPVTLVVEGGFPRNWASLGRSVAASDPVTRSCCAWHSGPRRGTSSTTSMHAETRNGLRASAEEQQSFEARGLATWCEHLFWSGRTRKEGTAQAAWVGRGGSGEDPSDSSVASLYSGTNRASILSSPASFPHMSPRHMTGHKAQSLTAGENGTPPTCFAFRTAPKRRFSGRSRGLFRPQVRYTIDWEWPSPRVHRRQSMPG
jgi:hypothetical protein